VSGTVGDYRERSCTLPKGDVRTIRPNIFHPWSVHDDEIVEWDETCMFHDDICQQAVDMPYS
jgi:hypothetical protein